MKKQVGACRLDSRYGLARMGACVNDHNYAVFDMKSEMPNFQGFPANLHAGERAPDFPLEDKETGQMININDLWADGPVVMEFGSFT